MTPIHPVHAILLAFPLPLFLGALLSDIAYHSSQHVQWANFSSWLIAGAMVAGTAVVLWSLTALFRGSAATKARRVAYAVVSIIMWGLGLVNALVHARDAWSTMPLGLYLSIVVSLLALAASWIGYSGLNTREEVA